MAAQHAMQATRIPLLNCTEQQRTFGIDCGDAIHFEAGAWLPGGEHVKKITVKNVSRRSIKFKYELPTTKYFSMDFPTIITLSPGMQVVLDVAFRPVKLEEYDDSVTFHVQIIEGGVVASSGRFRLPVIARIAALGIDIPQGLDFGFCPTAETTQKRFVMHNSGQIDAIFDWSLPGAGEHGRPFAVYPSSGSIRVGEALELSATFAPSVASVYVTTTVCAFRPCEGSASPGSQHHVKTMKISGISKYTYIAASETELNFGEILVGASSTSRTPTEKSFVLRNRSLVRASFQIVRVESDCDPVFFFSPLNGVLEPESSTTISVRFTPLSAGCFTCDHFEIVTPGGNREEITCKGRAIGPVVSLWKKNLESNFVRTQSINFRDLVVSKTISRVLTLRNESPIDVFFHFDCQQRGVFQFDKTAGYIPPLLDVNVTITFTPTRAGNFYRRCFLLLQNQNTLFVDVLGTAYDDKVRPSPFLQAHVDAYRLRAASGLALLSPDQLETYWQENGDDLFLQGSLRRARRSRTAMHGGMDEVDNAVLPSPEGKHETGDARATRATATPNLPAAKQLMTRSGEATLAAVKVCHEFFVNADDNTNPVVVTEASLDFGNCSVVEFPSKKVLRVTNNTHGKVTCSWRVASASENTGTSSGSAFLVFPETLDISPGATAEFRVAFQPADLNSYYFAELEGFVSFKSNRTFRLVNIETFTPPWFTVVKVCGNTFASPTEQFLPKITFRLPRRKVHFPPCYLGDQVFQTVMIENAGDTPALFAFVEEPSQAFTCKPSSGYIAAKSFHLVQIRFAPLRAKNYTHALQCIVNNARGNPETIELTGICALPQLNLVEDRAVAVDTTANSRMATGPEVRIFIKPTAVGLASTRLLHITNVSRVPLVFRWEIPHKFHDVFEVTPKLGRLNGRESAAIACRFTPLDVRAYMSRFTVSAKPISLAWTQRPSQMQTRIPVLQEISMRVQTKSTDGAIVFEPATLSFETILVNTSAKQTICIVNTADCDLNFALTQSVSGKIVTSSAEDHTADNNAANLEFSHTSGCIPARSRKHISVTFIPRVAGMFEFCVACHVASSASAVGEEAMAGLPWMNGSSLAPCVQQCFIHAEASFPTVVVEDIRIPRMPTALAWHQFFCHEINEYMSAPLSRDEVLAANDGGGSARPESEVMLVTSQPDASGGGSGLPAVRHFAVPFSPAPIGSPPQRVYVKLHNPGSLVVEFSLKYPKEGNVEIEHWAETSAPSSEEIRMNAIIDSQIFGLAPRRATLLPRQSVVLALSYSYASESFHGVHDLPVVLQVDKGKRIVLELQGRTLQRSEPKLFMPQRVFRLSPVILGEFRRSFADANGEGTLTTTRLDCDSGSSSDESPQAQRKLHAAVQQIEVFNQGDSAFRLEVSSNAFTKINNESYTFPVLRCTTTSEIVPAHSSVFVNLEFSPVEAKALEANLILKAHGLMGRPYKEAVMLTIHAIGFHPLHTTLAALRRELALGEAPHAQRIAVPGMDVRFVNDHVDLGHVPMHAESTGLLVLQHSGVGAAAVSFEWDVTHPLIASGVLRFTPTRGELAPGDEQLVRVAVLTSGEPLVVHHDVACVIAPLQPISRVVIQSPTKSSATRSAAEVRGSSKPTRVSVIARSTIAQESAAVRSVSGGGGVALDSANRKALASGALVPPKKIASNQNLLVRDEVGASSGASGGSFAALLHTPPEQSTAYPLYAHIYAHVLTRPMYERFYAEEVVATLPPPVVRETRPPSASPSYETMPARALEPFGADAACEQVVVDVMETVFADVLNSLAVQQAADDVLCPMSPHARAQKAAALASAAQQPAAAIPLYQRARQSEDCVAIVANVMENTVYNILQELFHGNLDEQLLCLPRKAVFGKPGSPRKSVLD